MLGLILQVFAYFKFRSSGQCIDNWVFRLHYRYTTLLLFLASIFVTARHYFGDHISCINDMRGGQFTKVIETYCFFMSTFTVVKDYDNKHAAHPGVGSYGIGSKDEIIEHKYYQWVPFILFFQAIAFHVPHLLWKRHEAGRIRMLVEGLDKIALSYKEEIHGDDNEDIKTSREKKQEHLSRIRSTFADRILCDKSWSRWLIFYEILNMLNLVAQVYFTDMFLAGKFRKLGSNLVEKGPNYLDQVFPKMTKCIFHKYGPSGSIQVHDALCILALNIIIEKIYIFLWFWFVILFGLSCSAIFYRILTIYLHSKSVKFNQAVFANNYLGKLHRWDVSLLMKKFSFTEWIFLKYLAKNLDPVIFRELFSGVIQDLEEDSKPLFQKIKGNDDWAKNFQRTNKFE